MKISLRHDGDPRTLKIVNDETGEEVENVIGVHLECPNKCEHILTVKFQLKTSVGRPVRLPADMQAKVDAEVERIQKGE